MDVLRGCAVMGILWMNITAFAHPSAAYFNPAATGSLSIADKIVWLVGFVAVDGKMRGLFSLLFGASMLLLIDKAEMAGRDGRRVHVIRSAWLFLFGLAHYLLLWWGDILMVYAVVGLIAMLFVGKDAMALVKWAFLFFALHFLLVGGTIASLYAWQHGATMAGASPAIASGYADFMAGLSDPTSAPVVREVALYRSGFSELVRHHLAGYPGEWLRSLMFTALDTIGFMLLGMAMLKGGFLTGRWDADQYRRVARHGFLIGVPPMVAIGGWLIWNSFPALPTMAAVLAWSFPFRIPLTVGWAALILWLFQRHRSAPLFTRIGAAGRVALTNYLGTSLVMTAIFQGWGLGLFGHVPLAVLPLFVLAGWTLMLAWPLWWTNHFSQGPLEWLWRSLARGQMQKIRRNS
jgi:uncharacterized protein